MAVFGYDALTGRVITFALIVLPICYQLALSKKACLSAINATIRRAATRSIYSWGHTLITIKTAQRKGAVLLVTGVVRGFTPKDYPEEITTIRGQGRNVCDVEIIIPPDCTQREWRGVIIMGLDSIPKNLLEATTMAQGFTLNA